MDQAEIQAIRQTMLRQESIFKEQVQELHSLYDKQKILFAKMNNNNNNYIRPALLGDSSTRNFLSIDDRSHKRPRAFDLEKLPDEEDEQDYPEIIHRAAGDYSVVPAADPPYAINSTTAGRTYVDLIQQEYGYYRKNDDDYCRDTVEMSLFPIPSRLPKENSELPLQQPPPQSEKFVGWNGGSTVGKLINPESNFWGHQHQHQQFQVPPQDPRQWFLQNTGGGGAFSLQQCNTTGLNQWRNNFNESYALGGGQAWPGQVQNGRSFSNGFGLNYPILNNVNVWSQHNVPTDLAWLQQAASYIPQQGGFGVKVEEKQVPWFTGNDMQTGSSLLQSLGLNKPAEIPKAREFGMGFEKQQEPKVTNGYEALVEDRKPTKVTTGLATPKPSEKSVPDANSEIPKIEVSARENNREENTGPSSNPGDETPDIHTRDNVDAGVASTSKTIGEISEEMDMSVTDTATILLSLSPDPEKPSSSGKPSSSKPAKAAKVASRGQASLEAKLLSDLKLFESVAIMLKKDLTKAGNNNNNTKKIPRPCRQQRGNAKTGSPAKTGAPQSWLWGDVTRRKRMQRQRPQVHV